MGMLEMTLANLTPGQAVKYENLTVYPLLEKHDTVSDYLTLDEAIENEQVRITEISEQGAVPELALTNTAEKAVLILDGEELIGAKQNRIINLTILAPAESTIRLPVSCVEQGRWAYDSSHFVSSRRVQFSTGRARKAANVSESMRHSRHRTANQSEVWCDISDKAARMNARSGTVAMADIFTKYDAKLTEIEAHFAPVAMQTGGIFALNGEIKGLELFDAGSTCRKVFPKLVQSYALDAIDYRDSAENDIDNDAVTRFLKTIESLQEESFPALGLGTDIRFTAPGLCGGALFHEHAIVHACVFRLDKGTGSSGRMSPASIRSRRWQIH